MEVMSISSKYKWVSEDGLRVVMHLKDIPPGTVRCYGWPTLKQAIAYDKDPTIVDPTGKRGEWTHSSAVYSPPYEAYAVVRISNLSLEARIKGKTLIPVPVPVPTYWSDGTYAIVRWSSVPKGVWGTYAAPCWETLITYPYSNDPKELVAHLAETMTAYPDAFCKVRIADMIAAHMKLENVPAAPPKTPLAAPITVNGASPEQCLARYKYLQRTDPGVPRPMTPELRAMGYVAGDKIALTEAQKMVAQDLWRKELVAKTKAAEIAERDSVKVDREFEEWE